MDWTLVHTDDRYLSDLAAGRPAAGDRLAELLTAWRDDVDADRMPLFSGRPVAAVRGCA